MNLFYRKIDEIFTEFGAQPNHHFNRVLEEYHCLQRLEDTEQMEQFLYALVGKLVMQNQQLKFSKDLAQPKDITGVS